MGASATTTVKRTDFGVGKPTPMLSDEIPIILDIELVKPAPSSAK
jgi:polyisoprenoid-binding protein YceI